MTIQTMNSREIRTNWSDVQRLAESGNTDVIAERNGKPTVALIGYQLYESLKPLIEEFRAAKRADDAMQEWINDPSVATSHQDFWAEMAAEDLVDGPPNESASEPGGGQPNG